MNARRQSAAPLLAGVRVVDCTEFLAGPYCTWVLAQMGAEVIKVERPGGDAMRRRALNGSDAVPFHMIHGNKKSVEVDLKTSAGQDAVRSLIASSDVFVENFRPGVAERMNLGAAKLRSEKPALIYCSIRGFREGTVYGDLAGVDPVAEALGGLASVTGDPDGPPVKTGFPVADVGTGMWAALGILGAYVRRLKSGAGEHVRASLLDTVLSWSGWPMSYYLMTGVNPPRLGSAHLYLAPFEFFKARDGRYFVVGIGSDHHWRRLCTLLSREDLVVDSRFSELYERGRNAEDLRLILRPIFEGRDASDWVADLEAIGIPTAPILRMEEVANSEYVRQAGMMPEVDGFDGPIRTIGFPVEFGAGSVLPASRGPALGAHNQSFFNLSVPQARAETDATDETPTVDTDSASK